MEELIEVLARHAERYPAMQPQDAVKLIYQNEFGGGHLAEAGWSLAYLEKEYAATERRGDVPLWEDIGNGVVRVNLAALDTDALPLTRLNDLFVRSSERHRGSMEAFQTKLALLEARLDDTGLGFSRGELADFLTTYRAAGCPMLSHSDVYRERYCPAYRVVLRELL